MDGDTQNTDTPGPSTVLEGETPSGHVSFSHDRVQLALMPGEPGMVGYLAPKYVLSDRGTYFVKGAFAKTAIEQLGKAHHLYQHWPDLTIGKHVAAEEDRIGFRVTVQINEDKAIGRDVMSDYRFGIPYGWSIGFDPVRDRSGKDDEESKLDRSGVPHLKNVPITELRAIEEVRWWEGSTVTWGAIHSAGPDTVQRRERFRRADVSLLIAAVRDGTLTPEQLSQIDELIAARQTRAGAGESHATPPVPPARQVAAELDLLFFELGISGAQAA
jgi:HK97 family phage prohead protease